LRLELSKWRIAVSLLEPGTIASEIRHKQQGAHAPYRRLTDPKQYELYRHFFEGFDARAAALDASAGPPQLTTDAVLHAVTSATPKTRYVVGSYQVRTGMEWNGPGRCGRAGGRVHARHQEGSLAWRSRSLSCPF
jgi:hypothetical protein